MKESEREDEEGGGGSRERERDRQTERDGLGTCLCPEWCNAQVYVNNRQQVCVCVLLAREKVDGVMLWWSHEGCNQISHMILTEGQTEYCLKN